MLIALQTHSRCPIRGVENDQKSLTDVGFPTISMPIYILFGNHRSFYLDAGFLFIWKAVSNLFGRRFTFHIETRVHFIQTPVSEKFGRRFPKTLNASFQDIWTPIPKNVSDLETGIQKYCYACSQPVVGQVAAVI